MIKDVLLGKNVKIYQPKLVNLYGCQIGENTKIAAFVEIQKGVRIGKNCKIQSFVVIGTGVTIEDGVFIGPHVCFINDKYPRATRPDGVLKQSQDWQVMPTRVKKEASIGAGAIIFGGLTIGERSMIGAGAVVNKDVKPHSVVAGNPARILKKK